MNDRFAALERRFGHEFKEHELLERALTHSSWARENGTSDNERLEFLGDAVVGLAVSDILMERFGGGEKDEGELSRIRASLVNGASLARAATSAGLGEFLLLGRGEDASGGREKESILEAAFEAVIGALFLDGGYQLARRVVKAELGERIEERPPQDFDPKSELQERLAAAGQERPHYTVSSKSGPDHMPTYEITVSTGAETLGRGRGNSRKAAEREAASKAIEGMEKAG